MDPSALPLPDEYAAPPRRHMEEPSESEEEMMILPEDDEEKGNTANTTTAAMAPPDDDTVGASGDKASLPPTSPHPPTTAKLAPENTALEAMTQASAAAAVPTTNTESVDKQSVPRPNEPTAAAVSQELTAATKTAANTTSTRRRGPATLKPPPPARREIQAMRDLFLCLTQQEFESEVEIEQRRRSHVTLPRKRAPPTAEAKRTATTRKLKKAKKNDNNATAVPLGTGGTTVPPFHNHMIIGGGFAAPMGMAGGYAPPRLVGMMPMPNMIMMMPQQPPPPPVFVQQQGFLMQQQPHGQPIMVYPSFQAPPPPPAVMSPQALAAEAQKVVEKVKASKSKEATGTTPKATPASGTTTADVAAPFAKPKSPLPPSLSKLPRHLNHGQWLLRFNELNRFKRKFGHLNVEHVANKDATYKSLHTWLKYQKLCWRKRVKGEHTLLTDTHIRAFVQLGLGTVEKGPALMDRIPTELRKPKARPVWTKQYQALLDFKAKHGHVEVSVKDPEYKSLYLWTQLQMNRYRNYCNGDKDCMSEDDVAKLKEVGLFSSDGKPAVRRFIPWSQRYQELVAFKKEFGHCDVSMSAHKETHYKLAWWVDCQRKAFKLRDCKETDGDGKKKDRRAAMTNEQLQMLAALGFTFASKHVPFEERYQNILQYKEVHGHVKIPWSFKTYNNLGQWCYIVKKRYHDGKLLPERAAMLESIEGWDWTMRGRKKGSNKGPVNYRDYSTDGGMMM